jgi:uncharacterized damage-inducible protein DinB
LKTFISRSIILLKQTKQTQQANQTTMSSISKIVNILSAKYGFDIKEATEHVKAEIQAYKNLTKEEKDAIKEAEKKAKADAKEAAKQAKAAVKQAKAAVKQAKKAEKPKKERTPAQEAALQKMIAANKAKREAKAVQVQKPENNKYFVTFHNKSKQMDAEDISLIEEDYKLEFIEQVEQITQTEIVPLCASNLSDYAKFVKKHLDDIDDNEFDSIWFCYQQPSQMNYTFVFQDEEYQMKYHKI